MRLIVVVLAVLALNRAVFTLAADGRVLHVSHAGSDQADGSKTAPWNSLAHAIDQLEAGDTLRIHAGEWRERIHLTEPHCRVEGVGEVILRSDRREVAEEIDAVVRVDADSCIIKNVEISNNSHGMGALITGEETTLEGIAFRRNGFAVRLQQTKETVIRHCTFEMQRRVDVYLDGTDGVTIGDCTFRNDRSWQGAPHYRRTSAISTFPTERASRDIRMERIRVEGYSYYGIDIRSRDQRGRIAWTHDVRLADSVLRDNGHAAEPDEHGEPEYNFGAVLWQGVRGGVVERNRFENNVGWGMDAYVCDSIVYTNNLFVNNRPGKGQRGTGDGVGMGLEVNAGQKNIVAHNLFTGNDVGLFSSCLVNPGDARPASVQVLNNLIVGNTGANGDGDFQWVGGSDEDPDQRFDRIVRANIIGTYSRWGPDLTSGPVERSNHLRVDPSFVDLQKGDFRLAAGSLAIDSGEPLSIAEVAKDIVGTRRPQRGKSDIGPYEMPADANLQPAPGSAVTFPAAREERAEGDPNEDQLREVDEEAETSEMHIPLGERPAEKGSLLARDDPRPRDIDGEPQNLRFEAEIGGEKRTWLVHLPGGPSTMPKGLPVVLNLHGWGCTAEDQRKWSHFDDIADEFGVIVIYPQATEASGKLWQFHDEIPYFDTILNHTAKRYAHDPDRVYVTGFSAGGFMAFVLASADFGHPIAAIAPVAAHAPLPDMNDDWQSLTPPKGGVPAMIVINCRDGLASGVPDTVEVLRQWNGVKTEPARGWLHTEPLVVEERHGEGASEILLVKFEADQPGLGTHFWPWTEQGVETSKWIWCFFASHGASD